jgi:hypothetical protein
MLKMFMILAAVAISAGLVWRASLLGAGEPAKHPSLDSTSVKDAVQSLNAISRDSSMATINTKISLAVAFLGERHFATQMLLTAQEDPKINIEQLCNSVNRVVESLTFHPWLEAKFPEGFPRFTPVHHIEVKTLPEYRMARVSMQDTQRKRDNGAFWKLFSHIKRHDIAMTAPVQLDYSGNADVEVASMAFLYGSRQVGLTGQDPSDKSVEVVDVPKQDVVSIGIRGRMSSESVLLGHRALLAWLRLHGDEYRKCGVLRRMGYNSPFISADRAFYELQIPIERIDRPVIVKNGSDVAR